MKVINRIAVLAVLILAFFLFPTIGATIGYLHANFYSFAAPKGSPVRDKRDFDAQESRKPRGGEYALPRHVHAIIAILRSNQVHSFHISAGLRSDAETVQRLIEGAYPIVHSDNAKVLVHREGESISSLCRPVFRQNGVVLAYCP